MNHDKHQICEHRCVNMITGPNRPTYESINGVTKA